jgi:hypothetical protein
MADITPINDTNSPSIQDGSPPNIQASQDQTPNENERIQNAQILQDQVLNESELTEDLQFAQQSIIRYPFVTTQAQADQYAQDLGLDDIKEVLDNHEKALHFYGFFDYMDQQKQAYDYVDNFIKVFQLAIFYDDNYLYRYHLAHLFFLKGDRELAITHAQDAVTKIQAKQISLYHSLAKEINVQVVKNALNDLLIKLNLTPLDDSVTL